MPVLKCVCGSELSIGLGRMLAAGAAGVHCPSCGQRLGDSAPAEQERGVEFAAADEVPAAVQSHDEMFLEDSDAGLPELPVATEDELSSGGFRWRDQLAASGISLGLHAVVLAVLGLFVFHPLLTPDLDLIFVETTWQREEGAEASLGDDGATQFVAAPVDSRIVHTRVSTEFTPSTLQDVTVDNPVLPTSQASQVLAPPPALPQSSLLSPVKPSRRSDPGKGGLIQGMGAGHATEGVLDGIRKELTAGPVQVVWLMDASISMNVDRQEVAARLYPFYKEMALRDKSESFPLLSSVVRFGAAPLELVKTTRDFTKVTNAVAALQDDTSGQENVFNAIQFCLAQYSRWQGTLIIVVWTDESGDDTMLLEDTLRVCRERDAVVHVVGPNAVFGSDRGTHLWRDGATGLTFRLPVKRGPETSLPERLMLPYWHDSGIPHAKMNGNLVAQDLPWYGGPMREGMLSGFGPYALTRLALMTGGTFTILNRPGDRTIATLEQLRSYTPDYSAAREYLSEVQSLPLRKAVSDASLLIWQAPQLEPPPMTFLFSRQIFYPFAPYIDFRNPANFRTAFRDNLQKAIAGSQAEQAIIEKAIASFEATDLEPAYEEEKSLRWKAWYDLNYGRLLANSVRHIEYQLTCAAILTEGGLNPETNHVRFETSKQYKGGRLSESRAIRARELLERCRKKNAGTQWDRLAEWELNRELGLQARQIVIPPPPPPKPPTGPVSPPRPATKVTFPTL